MLTSRKSLEGPWRPIASLILLVGVVVAGAVAPAVSGATTDDAAEPIWETRPGGMIRDFVSPEAEAQFYAEGRSVYVGKPPLVAQRRASQVVPGQITVTYLTPVPGDVQVVVEQAADAWEVALDLNPSAVLEMTFAWVALDPLLLGQAGANGYSRVEVTEPFIPAALVNQFISGDVSPNEAELAMELNQNISWHLDPSTEPDFADLDLFSVVLHEMAHGLGFAGGAFIPNGSTTPIVLLEEFDVYDLLIYTETGESILSLDDAARSAALVSNTLEIELGGGLRYPVFSPNPFQQGSSYTHFDEDLIETGMPGCLMTAALSNGEQCRAIDAPTLGVMAGMDWKLSQPPLAVTPGEVTVAGSRATVTWSADLAQLAMPPDVVRIEAINTATSEVDATATAAGGAGTAQLTGLRSNTVYQLQFTPIGESYTYDTFDTFPVTGTPAETTFISATFSVAALTDAVSVDEIVNAGNYNPSVDAEILRLYKAFFNREPDHVGAIYWIELSRGNIEGFGETPTDKIAEAFTGASEEFQNFYADAPTDEEFLTRAYSNVLGRGSDPDGYAYWLDILKGTNATGQNPGLQSGGRGTVVFWVAKGAEFVNQNPYLPVPV